jgi:hypothetical protein
MYREDEEEERDDEEPDPAGHRDPVMFARARDHDIARGSRVVVGQRRSGIVPGRVVGHGGVIESVGHVQAWGSAATLPVRRSDRQPVTGLGNRSRQGASGR